VPLREAARSAVIEGRINPLDPTPRVLDLHHRPEQQTIAITNPALKSGLWGPADRITLSTIKTDVQDRRVKWPEVVTLEEIREGAFAPANKNDIPDLQNTSRPVKGYLKASGGRVAPYSECWHAYPFPCQKPVGQIILMLDELKDGSVSNATQSCAHGKVSFQMEKGDARADMEVVLSMTQNVYAIRAEFTGLKAPAHLRLYRHQDQGHLRYMTLDGRFRDGPIGDVSKGAVTPLFLDGHEVLFDYKADAAWNGPIDPPESGHEGRYFWITQKMPAEKTFPKGFHYVMMGLISPPIHAALDTVNGKTGLGMPPPDETIRNAPGSAATATFAPDNGHAMTAYVVVVSEIDAPDFMGEARRRLDAAEADGFDGIVKQNTSWYDDLYDCRESGRVYYSGQSEKDVTPDAATEDLPAVYASWYCGHGGGCKTDMRRYQASASYSRVESDWQPWHGYPCYNEWFYDSTYVRNRADAVDMWKQLVEHYWQAARANARQVFNMPGMVLVHGYQPPIKADHYLHTKIDCELALDTMAGVLKSIWDEWDYGGNQEFLEQAYPKLRDMVIFYASYAKKGSDNRYHVIPCEAAEDYGIFPEFSHNIDSTSSLSMFRWALLRVADAAELLQKDADLRDHWREIAEHIAPYPTWEKPEGTVFSAVRNVEPFYFHGDHPFFAAFYPTRLGDDINLDSAREEKDIMLRTARLIQAPANADVLVLLGASAETTASILLQNRKPILDWKTLRTEINLYPERVLNSRSGRIHLFPCVPSNAVVAFRKFQARGGLLVSAARDAHGVYLVEIEARRDGACSIMNPWPQRRIAVREMATRQLVPFSLDKSNGECVTFSASAQNSYRIERV
jgi:hypothetical protein